MMTSDDKAAVLITLVVMSPIIMIGTAILIKAFS